ncbi:hypothetical protein Daus18300_006799 [Diaporthe australafricana]|uniref:Nicotinamide N-methyltransferase n=1 Tax=Diaporthe australafricana TaxID=127596 RepID=A0ABR3WRR6_9PEZI
MALTSRITLTGAPAEDPEDFFGASLGVIFPDDVMNQHGDPDHGLLYQSPHLPKPLHISLADPSGEDDRRLFSHYLWNASLLLAEFVESGTLGLGPDQGGVTSPCGPPLPAFNVAGLSILELGAGTALPSLLAALLGASRVVLTDYPAPAVIANLSANAVRNARPELSPSSSLAATVEVEGHSWGELSTPLAERNRRAFDRVFVCDCLWMPWQHGNLLKSVEWFLKDSAEARCEVVAGFHTGREKMKGFFEEERLRELGLEVESIWERDCDGLEREWVLDRGIEDPVGRKRWLVFAILKRSRP